LSTISLAEQPSSTVEVFVPLEWLGDQYIADLIPSKTENDIATMSARTDTEATQNQASSGVTPNTLKATLTQKLEATHVDIEDLSGEWTP